MLHQMIRKIRKRSLGLIIGSVLIELLVICIALRIESIGPRSIIIACWSVALIYCLWTGIAGFTGSVGQINQYCSQSGVPFSDLDRESLTARDVYGVNLGSDHLFYYSATAITVLPYHSIRKLKLHHVGQNYGKGRSGTYYLCFHGQNIPKHIHFCFEKKAHAQQVMDEIQKKNPSVQIV